MGCSPTRGPLCEVRAQPGHDLIVLFADSLNSESQRSTALVAKEMAAGWSPVAPFESSLLSAPVSAVATR